MDQSEQFRQITQQSQGLVPIYEKVSELKAGQQMEKKKLQGTIKKLSIQPINKLDLLLGIDRKQQFLQKRMTSNGNFYGANTIFKDKNKTTKFQSDDKHKSLGKLNTRIVKKLTKSQRIINFLKTNKNKNYIVKNTIQVLQSKNIGSQRQIFTPLRAISRNPSSVVSSRSKSQRISHGNISQKLRLQKTKVGSPKKYLRKGQRMRQALVKQLKDDDIDEEGQLAYMKQYDQWVPEFLLNRKRLQLQHFMSILKGQKVKGRQRKQLLQPIYL